MNKFLTKALFKIFGRKNKSGFTIPELHRMKTMNPKEKKIYVRELKNKQR